MTTANVEIRAQDNTQRAFDAVNRRLFRLGGVLGSTQAKIAGLVGAAGFGALIVRSMRVNDSLAKTVDQLQVNAEAFGGLQYAVRQTADVTDSALGNALEKATKRLGDFAATGTGPAGRWIEKLNLDVAELQSLSPDQLFLRYGDAIGELNDRGEQLAAISALMGDEARGLITTFDAGTDAIREMSDEAVTLGIALNRADLAKIEAANDSLARSMAVVEGIANRVTVAMAPYIEALSNTFADAAVEHGGFEQQIIDGSEKIAMAVAKTADVSRGLEVVWQGLKVVFWGVVAGVLTGLERIVDATNRTIELANRLPGIQIETYNALSGAAAGAREQLEETQLALYELAMRPMPSDQVEAFFTGIRERAAEAAMAVADAQQGRINGAPAIEAEAQTVQLDERLQQQLDQIRESFADERELLRLHIEEREFNRRRRVPGGIDRAGRALPTTAEHRKRAPAEDGRDKQPTPEPRRANVARLLAG